MSDPSLDEAERRCYEALALLRLEYERAARPYIDQLVKIRNMRPPQPMIIPLDRMTQDDLARLTEQMP